MVNDYQIHLNFLPVEGEFSHFTVYRRLAAQRSTLNEQRSTCKTGEWPAMAVMRRGSGHRLKVLGHGQQAGSLLYLLSPHRKGP